MLLWLQFLTTFLVSLYSTFLIATHLKKHFYLVATVWEASEYGNFIKTSDWSGHLKKKVEGWLVDMSWKLGRNESLGEKILKNAW